jgi:Domain of unknown function (DU1801)
VAQKLPAATAPTLEATRKMVRSVAPKAQEISYEMKQPSSSRTMWKLYRYAVDGDNVVGIGTFPDHANLYFYRGVDLDDGTGLLQGGGKLMRSITLRKPADAERADVKRIVRKAFRLAAG